jgi:hypothetical protein
MNPVESTYLQLGRLGAFLIHPRYIRQPSLERIDNIVDDLFGLLLAVSRKLAVHKFLATKESKAGLTIDVCLTEELSVFGRAWFDTLQELLQSTGGEPDGGLGPEQGGVRETKSCNEIAGQDVVWGFC